MQKVMKTFAATILLPPRRKKALIGLCMLTTGFLALWVAGVLRLPPPVSWSVDLGLPAGAIYAPVATVDDKGCVWVSGPSPGVNVPSHPVPEPQYLAKISPQGRVLLRSCLAVTAKRCIAISACGGGVWCLFVASAPVSRGSLATVLVRVDAEGAVIKRIEMPEEKDEYGDMEAFATGIATDSDGSVFVCGVLRGRFARVWFKGGKDTRLLRGKEMGGDMSPYSYSRGFVRKIDTSGRTLWRLTLATETEASAVSAASGVVAVATSVWAQPEEGTPRTYVIAFSSSGKRLWRSALNHLGAPGAIALSPAGDVYVASGETYGEYSDIRVWLTNLDNCGHEKWVRMGAWPLGPNSLASAGEGVYVAQGNGTKISKSGRLCWSTKAPSQRISAAIVDGSQAVYFAGVNYSGSLGNRSSYKAFLKKLR